MREPEPGEYEPFDHETLPVAGVAVALTPTKAAPSTMARITVETAEIRYWIDGGSPTLTQGILAGPSSTVYLYATEITRARFIAASGTTANLQVTYGRRPIGQRGVARVVR